MNNKVSQSYSVRRGDLARDRDDILRLWSCVADGEPPGKEKLDWFYVNNPGGDTAVYLLDYLPENRPVGIMCAAPRRFVIDGEEKTGAVFGDFVIEPAHRSLGPGLMLQKESVEAATQEFDLQFGFPNVRSSRLRRYAGYTIQYYLGIYVLPLDIRYYLQKRLPAWFAAIPGSAGSWFRKAALSLRAGNSTRGHRLLTVDETFANALWASVSASGRNMGRRDWEYLNWRILGDPMFDHKLFGIADANGEPAAYLAYRSTQDLHTVVVDYLALSDEAFKTLLVQFAADQAHTSARSISVTEQSSDGARIDALRSLGFRKRGESEAYLAFSKEPDDANSAPDVYLNLVDNDV